MHIDKLIEKLDEEVENTKSHQRKIELIGKIEDLKEKRKNMESWEVKDVNPDKYL
ncbi:MAG: hypothetical protein ACOCTT_03565 [archaeon]